MFATSSFQSQSVPLIHILSELPFKVPIYLVNTGFLFPETLTFKDTLIDLLDLEVRQVSSSIPKIHQLNQYGRFHFTSDPERCCYVNKTEPVNRLLPQFDVWISGVRRDQTQARKNLDTFQRTSFDCLRFHPMLDWTQEDVRQYVQRNQLPNHPLFERGYKSIGCLPCTEQTDGREGRWAGLRKTECGLHTHLAEKCEPDQKG